MKKAIFLDFYGTVVREDGPIVLEVLQKVCAGGGEQNPKQILKTWWQYFNAYVQDANSHKFYNQYTLAEKAFQETVKICGSTADPKWLCNRMVEHWTHSPAFPEVQEFFKQLSLPYYFITNGDSIFLEKAIAELGLKPSGIISSEKAEAYKPDPRIFQAALKDSQLEPSDVVHIGDSKTNDADAAKSVGIHGIWLNRKEEGSPSLSEIHNLTQLFELPEILH